MAANIHEAAKPKRTGRRGFRARFRVLVEALEHLVGGFGTAALAAAVLLWLGVVAIACLVRTGRTQAPSATRAVRGVAERERARRSRWGPAVVGPPMPPAPGLRAAFADPDGRREVRWLIIHGTLGLALGIVGLTLVVNAVQDVTYARWWRLLPPGSNTPGLVFWGVKGAGGA